MPIRINLLAEAQAVEELRRKDPAKRAIWVAAILVAMILAWSSVLQARIIMDGSTLSNRQSASDSLTKAYTNVMDNEKKLGQAVAKLTALGKFTTNRFLQAPLLDALMQTPVEGIQLTVMRTEQTYEINPEAKGHPATSTERIKLVLEAKDSSRSPGDEQIAHYIKTLTDSKYFQAAKITTNNISMRLTGVLQIDNETGKPFVPFTLDCTYPERTR